MTSTEPAIGIDLGTTFSVIAYLDSTGRPQTIVNFEGEALTPSVVFFDASSVVVGKEAVKASCLEPEGVAEYAKRDMGCPIYSKAINGEHYPPEVVQSFVLEKLKQDAQSKIGTFQKAVITVPAYFNEPRRKATQDAGHLAGIEVLDIINEPTAAAIDFGFQKGFLSSKGESQRPETILVYDLGGGTFDVTLMHIDGTSYTARATAGDVYLGGIDWNRRMVDYLAEEFKTKYRFDPKDNPSILRRLMQTVEDAKRTLSSRPETTVMFDHAGETVRLTITRQQFESLTSDLLERTRLTVRNVLRDAALEWKDVTRLLVVGGSTRMPMVQNMLEEESGKKVDRSLSADEAVAHGAALYAGLLLNSRTVSERKISVRNVNSHNLSVLGIESETGRPRSRLMIPRNTVLPATKAAFFKTFRDNQPSVAVQVVEGGDVTGQNSTPIGKCVIQDLPPGLPGGTPVEVVFEYADNGRLTVKAHLPKAKRAAVLTIQRESGLSDTMLHDWSDRLKDRTGPLKLN
jgi:molecular chaperone DnaK